MYGSHLSIAGSMVNALTEAESLALDTVQVFTKNQQQWKAKPLDPAMVTEWRAVIARLGWHDRTVSHASYLINLASIKDDLWAQSVDLMTDEIERCETLGIPFLVHHPGSFVGADLATGLSRIASAYAEIFKRTKGYRTISCLEGTVGAGSTIGGRFEELRDLRALINDRTGEPQRVGFCLDTCHMHAAGYDLSTRTLADAALALFDEVCGMANLKAMHINDSKGAAGSKLDRHQHIGEGTIGGAPGNLPASGFASVVNHPHIRTIPKILETPKEDASEKPRRTSGSVTSKNRQPFDAINVQRLRALIDGANLPFDDTPISVPTPSPTPAKAPAKARGAAKAAPGKKATPSARPKSPKPEKRAEIAPRKPKASRQRTVRVKGRSDRR